MSIVCLQHMFTRPGQSANNANIMLHREERATDFPDSIGSFMGDRRGGIGFFQLLPNDL